MRKNKKSTHLKDEPELTKEEKIVLNAKTAAKVRFDVYKGHYYDCAQVDDAMDALLALIDMQDDKIRFYEKRIVDDAIREHDSVKKADPVTPALTPVPPVKETAPKPVQPAVSTPTIRTVQQPKPAGSTGFVVTVPKDNAESLSSQQEKTVEATSSVILTKAAEQPKPLPVQKTAPSSIYSKTLDEILAEISKAKKYGDHNE